MQADAAAAKGVVQIYSSASGAVAALRGVDMRFPRGSVTAIVGPSGAGKSTLLRLLAGLEHPAAGTIELAGTRLSSLGPRARRRTLAREVGYVFQRPNENVLAYMTVAEHLELAFLMRVGSRLAGCDALDICEDLGLSAVASHPVSQLPSGLQQVLAFGMAAVGSPSLVVADEPSSELDEMSTTTLVRLTEKYSHSGVTFVIATHDAQWMGVAHRVVRIRSGLVDSSVAGECRPEELP